MSTIQAFTTAARPAASASNVGLTIFNTTTKDINVSDGTGWRVYEDDATTANTLSLEFDGGDRLDTTYGPTASALSASFWMKSSDTSSYTIIFDCRDSGGAVQYINLWRPPSANLSGQRFWYPVFKTASGTNANSPNITQGGTTLLTTDSSHDSAYTAGIADSFFDNNWHHVVITVANENVSGTTTTRYIMYKDGTEFINQLCTTANGWTNNDPFVPGGGTSDYSFGDRRVGSSLTYSGKMDQMAFFESALSSTDVSDIYNSGNGGDLLTLGFSPAAYYRVGYVSEDTNSNGNTASAGQDIGTVADYSGNNNDASQSSTSLKPNYVADVPWS